MGSTMKTMLAALSVSMLAVCVSAKAQTTAASSPLKAQANAASTPSKTPNPAQIDGGTDRLLDEALLQKGDARSLSKDVCERPRSAVCPGHRVRWCYVEEISDARGRVRRCICSCIVI